MPKSLWKYRDFFFHQCQILGDIGTNEKIVRMAHRLPRLDYKTLEVKCLIHLGISLTGPVHANRTG